MYLIIVHPLNVVEMNERTGSVFTNTPKVGSEPQISFRIGYNGANSAVAQTLLVCVLIKGLPVKLTNALHCSKPHVSFFILSNCLYPIMNQPLSGVIYLKFISGHFNQSVLCTYPERAIFIFENIEYSVVG